ncbi:MAG: 4Fe-4S binding protein [Anaerolineales bacterium]|nr:4Fe-4S binding protein [Anaerolineales bacterium]
MVEREQPVPLFNYAICDSCGECVAICPEHVLVMMGDPERPHLQSGVECSYCGLCEQACNNGAIYLTYEIHFGF